MICVSEMINSMNRTGTGSQRVSAHLVSELIWEQH
jgi:hypothetical protein